MVDLKRRALLTNLANSAATAAARAAAELFPPQRRPPGALREAEFLGACTRCSKCSDACPESAIFKFTESGGRLADTPVMLPEERACLMCDGFPCAAACEDGALLVPEAKVWSLGKVAIAKDRCLAHLGPECGACVGLCPSDVVAIELKAWKPHVLAEACVGCGLCIAACPTEPGAIEMLPLDAEA